MTHEAETLYGDAINSLALITTINIHHEINDPNIIEVGMPNTFCDCKAPINSDISKIVPILIQDSENIEDLKFYKRKIYDPLKTT